MTTPDSIALTPLGACEWASGSQVCSGTSAVFTPKPIRNSAPAASSGGGVGRAAVASTCCRSSVPVWANTNAMPIRTRAEPTADWTRYFTPASSAPRCSR